MDKKRINGRPAISLTFYLILICSILFFIDTMSAPQLTTIDTNLPIVPQTASSLKKDTLYDFPEAYVLADKLINQYGLEALKAPAELPKDGQELYDELKKTPYWHGEYNTIKQDLLKGDGTPTINTGAPLFEKIRKGEVWRLITPSLMHHDLLHLLFNMLWLVVLGQQMEQRLGNRRYILFALIVGIVSNTCQYLMSGPDFIGYSGIICGMLTFIWMRQKVAAWEGYPLQKSTINFMLIFIVAMMLLQLTSFYLETNQGSSISPGIANTAHLSGAILGAILGRLSIFSWKA